MKVQFWIEQGLLPYLLKDVPHTVVARGEYSLKIEIEANGTTLINLVFAAKSFGMEKGISIYKENFIAA